MDRSVEGADGYRFIPARVSVESLAGKGRDGRLHICREQEFACASFLSSSVPRRRVALRCREEFVTAHNHNPRTQDWSHEDVEDPAFNLPGATSEAVDLPQRI